jgi:HSP20 family molecular chaperone IbpA
MGVASASAGHLSPSTGLLVHDEPSEYIIELDVSGFEQDELTLESFGRELTVLGEHPSDGGAPLHARRRLEDSFRIPDDADAERIGAVYRHGALEIHVRREPVWRRTVPIERDHLSNPTPKGC